MESGSPEAASGYDRRRGDRSFVSGPPRTDLRRVSYPEFVALLGEHTLKPVGSPGGFHPDARRSLKCYLKLVGFASPMVQSRIQYFARYRINHRLSAETVCENRNPIRCIAQLLSSEPWSFHHDPVYSVSRSQLCFFRQGPTPEPRNEKEAVEGLELKDHLAVLLENIGRNPLRTIDPCVS